MLLLAAAQLSALFWRDCCGRNQGALFNFLGLFLGLFNIIMFWKVDFNELIIVHRVQQEPQVKPRKTLRARQYSTPSPRKSRGRRLACVDKLRELKQRSTRWRRLHQPLSPRALSALLPLHITAFAGRCRETRACMKFVSS